MIEAIEVKAAKAEDSDYATVEFDGHVRIIADKVSVNHNEKLTFYRDNVSVATIDYGGTSPNTVKNAVRRARKYNENTTIE